MAVPCSPLNIRPLDCETDSHSQFSLLETMQRIQGSTLNSCEMDHSTLSSSGVGD